MTKSSMPRRVFPPLFLLAAPAALAAQSPTPEEAIERQRAEIVEVVSQVCPPGADPGDPNAVLVCGRRPPAGGPGDQRVPWEPAEGRFSQLPGERAGQIAPADACTRMCSQPVTINVFAAYRALRRGLDRLLHPD